MNFSLGVVIDNSRLVWLYDSEHSSTRPVRLTTVTDNQHKADIKFYIKHSGKKEFLCTENIINIPLMKAGEPSIDIKPRVSSKTFFYEIFVNGRLVRRSSCKLNKYLRTKTPFLIGGISLVAVILILLGIFYLPPLLRAGEPPRGTVETNVKQQPDVRQSAEQARPVEKKPEENQPAKVDTSAQTENPVPEQTEVQQEKEQPIVSEPPPEPETKSPVFVESEITDRYSVYFKPDSPDLTAEARLGLSEFIQKLPTKKDFDEAEFELEVRGHCARYGTEEGRAELSRERALTVYNYLKSQWGIEADSLVSGAGASEPVTLKLEEQYLNRRVDINIKGNIRKIETQD